MPIGGKLLALVTLAALCAGLPVSAKDRLARAKVSETSADGVLLFRLPMLEQKYGLTFSQIGETGVLSRIYWLEVPGGGGGERLFGHPLKPGRYRMNAYHAQDFWGMCHAPATLEFTVHPGVVTHAGRLNVEALQADLERSIFARGRQSITMGSITMARDPQVAPRVALPDAAALEADRPLLLAQAPGVEAPMRPAEVRETSFTVSGFGSATSACG